MSEPAFDGGILRRLRKEAGLSLRQLAMQTEVSASLLSQLERGVTTPSIGTLKKLAEVLQVSVFHLMPGEEQGKHGVVRANRRRRLVLEHDELKYELLSPHTRGRLEVWHGRLAPGASAGSEESTHPSEEFILVLHGEMEITIGGDAYLLKPGDSIQYDGRQPHGIQCIGTQNLEFISALTPPTL